MVELAFEPRTFRCSSKYCNTATEADFRFFYALSLQLTPSPCQQWVLYPLPSPCGRPQPTAFR